MSKEADSPVKRMTLRLPVPLWKRLHVQSGREATSIHQLILDWLEEKAEERERAERRED